MVIESQSDANRQPIGWQLTPNPMLIDCQSDVNGHPILWKLSHSPPIQCHLRSKTLNWPWFRFVRVPPLKIFWGTFRPMRSQHSELSTNQKPRFRPDSHCWTKLKSTNPREMCQLTADGMSLNCNWTVNRMPKDYQLMSIDCQWSVPRIPMECLLTVNVLPIDDQWNANWPPFDWQ